jgi:hypothetical protein
MRHCFRVNPIIDWKIKDSSIENRHIKPNRNLASGGHVLDKSFDPVALSFSTVLKKNFLNESGIHWSSSA